MITIDVVNPAEIAEYLTPLHEDHYKGDFREDAVDLDIDWDLYSEMYDNGTLLCVVAHDDKKPLAYMTTILSQHHHNKEDTVAKMDTLYVSPDYRGQGLASLLFEFTEEELTEIGVAWFTATFRDEATAESVTGKYGYKKVEVSYAKTLRNK